MIVYLITNLINNKKYVGYTQKTLDERIKTHLYKSRSKSNKHYFYLLPIAIRKYGRQKQTKCGWTYLGK